VLVVDVPEATQIERLMRRDGVSRDQAEAALRAQASRDARLAFADDVIENTGDLAALETRVAKLHGDYLRRAGA
jgi:dephospho-CoA kinase